MRILSYKINIYEQTRRTHARSYVYVKTPGRTLEFGKKKIISIKLKELNNSTSTFYVFLQWLVIANKRDKHFYHMIFLFIFCQSLNIPWILYSLSFSSFKAIHYVLRFDMRFSFFVEPLPFMSQKRDISILNFASGANIITMYI